MRIFGKDIDAVTADPVTFGPSDFNFEGEPLFRNLFDKKTGNFIEKRISEGYGKDLDAMTQVSLDDRAFKKIKALLEREGLDTDMLLPEFAIRAYIDYRKEKAHLVLWRDISAKASGKPARRYLKFMKRWSNLVDCMAPLFAIALDPGATERVKIYLESAYEKGISCSWSRNNRYYGKITLKGEFPVTVSQFREHRDRLAESVSEKFVPGACPMKCPNVRRSDCKRCREKFMKVKKEPENWSAADLYAAFAETFRICDSGYADLVSYDIDAERGVCVCEMAVYACATDKGVDPLKKDQGFGIRNAGLIESALISFAEALRNQEYGYTGEEIDFYGISKSPDKNRRRRKGFGDIRNARITGVEIIGTEFDTYTLTV